MHIGLMIELARKPKKTLYNNHPQGFQCKILETEDMLGAQDFRQGTKSTHLFMLSPNDNFLCMINISLCCYLNLNEFIKHSSLIKYPGHLYV